MAIEKAMQNSQKNVTKPSLLLAILTHILTAVVNESYGYKVETFNQNCGHEVV